MCFFAHNFLCSKDPFAAFFGLHIDVDNFRKRVAKGLDEVHPFSDTPSIYMVLADMKQIFTSLVENVSVKNILRV